MIAPRRFWTEVAVTPDEGGGFGLRLDDRPLRTPAHEALLVPTRDLAEAIATEWRDLGDEIRPEALPFTRAVNVTIDRVARNPGPVIDAIAAYGETDLLCYRAEGPLALRARQSGGWDPVLAWAAAALDAPLRTTIGVVHVSQPPASIAALRRAVAGEGPFQLTALHQLVALSGSLLLGLAVARGAWAAEDAWRLSQIDEFWQSEQWGADAEAEEATAFKRDDFLRAAAMLEMLAVPNASA